MDSRSQPPPTCFSGLARCPEPAGSPIDRSEMTIGKLIPHPEKVFWPDEGHTKLDVARFYEFVFPKLQTYLADRLLTMERCPDGMRGGCFYQKEAPKGLPAKAIQHENREVNYVVGGSLETQL